MTSQEPGDESPCPALQRSALPPAAPPGVPGPELPPAPPAGGQCPLPLRRPLTPAAAPGTGWAPAPAGRLAQLGHSRSEGPGAAGGREVGSLLLRAGRKVAPAAKLSERQTEMPAACWGRGRPPLFPLVGPGVTAPAPSWSSGQKPGQPTRGDRWLGEGKQVPTAHRGEPTPSLGSWARQGGAGATAPQVSPPPRPRDPQLLPALTTLPQPAGPRLVPRSRPQGARRHPEDGPAARA